MQTQKEPNDSQYLCKSHRNNQPLRTNSTNNNPQIIAMMLEGFPWNVAEEKGKEKRSRRGFAPLRFAHMLQVASKQASKPASSKKQRKEEKDQTENAEKNKDAQRPNDF